MTDTTAPRDPTWDDAVKALRDEVERGDKSMYGLLAVDYLARTADWLTANKPPSPGHDAAQRVIETARHACDTLRRTGNPAEVYLGDVQRALAEYDAAQKEEQND